MRKIICKYNWLILIILFSNNIYKLYGQNMCETKTINGVFAYEQSYNLWSIDDMIYRRASLVEIKNDTVNYMAGIYTFEYNINVPVDCINEKNKSTINYNTNSLNDSLHSILGKKETFSLKENGGIYKIFNLELQVLYLGRRKIYITNGVKFTFKEIPCYLILNFNKIYPLVK